MCVSDALMKALSQEPQLNGRSPRCCRSWSFRWDLCLKAFSHIWQAKGLKPEWIFRCSLRCAAVVKTRGNPRAPYYPFPDPPSGWRPERASRGPREPGSPGSSCWSARVSACTGYPGS
uniref:Uncharacterized protein n=1 Tax=Dicentrarchus labrax TaxID=13489 RepID=A0A8C4P104_DICLA